MRKNIKVLIAIKRGLYNSKRKKRKFKGLNNVYHKELVNKYINDKKILEKNPSPLYEFLVSKGYIEFDYEVTNMIVMPKVFSLEHNNKVSHSIISKIIYAIVNNVDKNITIDFTNCEQIDEPSIFFLNIILIELNTYFNNVNAKTHLKVYMPKLTILKSKHKSVNIILTLYRSILYNIKDFDVLCDDIPVKLLDYLKGRRSQKHYLENKKDIFTTKIVKYLNDCLIYNGVRLTIEGINEMQGIISEILNNAEDHSPYNEYYVTSSFSMNAFNTSDLDKSVGTMNIQIMNFGYSMYEGLTDNKDENESIYSVLDDGWNNIGVTDFTKENLFTLYALQDGISRLAYTDPSRGTGTMKFITSFFGLGDFEDKSKSIMPHLKIFSGNTLLICDNNFKPIMKHNYYLLPLNKENDLKFPPEKSHLKTLHKGFPGTLLSVKIYFNKEHLNSKLNNSSNAN